MSRIVCLLTCVLVACNTDVARTELFESAQETTVTLTGSVGDNFGIIPEFGTGEVPDPVPAACVRVYSYSTGNPIPSDTTDLALDLDGNVSGTVPLGDFYRADLLDANEDPADGSLTLRVGDAAAFFPRGADAGQFLESYGTVDTAATLTVDGDLVPAVGSDPVASIEYGVVQYGFVRSRYELSVTPEPDDSVSIDIDIPLYGVNNEMVYVVAYDSTGEPVNVLFDGDATTDGNVVFGDDGDENGGVLF